MREFKLLRYFQKWWWLVVLCSVIGGAAFCYIAIGSQTYVAQTVLAYINKEAETGLTPNGLPIKPGEVTSSWVITQALEKAGLSESVDRIRSRISITEDIPDDIATVQKAAWSEGLEYEYFPTEYVISYNSGEDSSADEARAILEAIVDSYYSYYGQHYIGTALMPTSIKALLSIEYDPIELVEALDEYVEQIADYVSSNAIYSPHFRSARTGYSFQNLESEYKLFQETTLPSLYAQVLGNGIARDRDVLMMKYEKRIADHRLEIENLETRAADIEAMIQAFVEKNQESMDYHWSSEDDVEQSRARGTDYVLGQVYEYESGHYESEQTTYDSLLLQYVSNNDSIEALKLDIEYCEYIINAYSAAGTPDENEMAGAGEQLTQACEALRSLEDVLYRSVTEYTEYRAAQNLAITSTVNVYSTMNLMLYLALAVVLFFFIGCIGAIFLGRGQDFLEYALYVDHTSNLPNRKRCDAVLERYSQKPVEPPFSCVYLKITNLAELNMAHGYKSGTKAIATMGKLMRLCAEDFGFVGYNDSAQFMGIFEGCSGERSIYFLTALKSAIDAHNTENPDSAIKYRAARASLEVGEAGTARELLRRCISELGTNA